MELNDFVENLEEKASMRGAKGKRRGDPRGGGEAGSRTSRNVNISKALSRLLRHQAENAGIKLDTEGFAPLDKVVSCSASICCFARARRQIPYLPIMEGS